MMERQKARPKEVIQTTQYLSFFIAGEEYAVDILRVKEILEFGNLTRIPATPPWVRGVINLRGAVVPVLDLALKLGLPATEVTKRACVVIVETQLEGTAHTLGIMVDSVSQVVDLSPSNVEPPPAFGNHIRIDFLLGMGKIDSKFVLLLDIDRVLSFNELMQVTELGA